MQPLEFWKNRAGRGDPPKELGSCSGPLLILGGARCVWDDYAKVRPWPHDLMVINDLGSTLHDPFQHWVTLHGNYAADWKRYRLRHGGHKEYLFHSKSGAPHTDVVWNFAHSGSVSGLFACFIALLLGYDRIILAGCPQDGQGHYFDPPWEQHKDFSRASNEGPWTKALPILAGKVTSLSGRTREWLGSPF